VTADAEELLELRPARASQFLVEFDSDPLWLLAIDTHWVEAIWVPGFASLAHMGRHIVSAAPAQANLYNRVVTRLGRRRFSFSLVPSDHSVVLASGDSQFREATASRYRGPALLAMVSNYSSTQRKRRQPSTPGVLWHKVRAWCLAAPPISKGIWAAKGSRV
jgi:hypothetical protein